MICWKDKSFCEKAPQCKHAEECGRGISREEVKQAEKAGFPVAYLLDCPLFESKEDKECGKE